MPAKGTAAKVMAFCRIIEVNNPRGMQHTRLHVYVGPTKLISSAYSMRSYRSRDHFQAAGHVMCSLRNS